MFGEDWFDPPGLCGVGAFVSRTPGSSGAHPASACLGVTLPCPRAFMFMGACRSVILPNSNHLFQEGRCREEAMGRLRNLGFVRRRHPIASDRPRAKARSRTARLSSDSIKI